MTRLIPPRIDREEVEECVQALYVLEEQNRVEGNLERVKAWRAGRVVLERVLGEEDA